MKKVVIKMKDGDYVNILADELQFEKSNIIAKNEGKVVAVVKAKEIVSCYLSVQMR